MLKDFKKRLTTQIKIKPGLRISSRKELSKNKSFGGKFKIKIGK